MTGTSVLHHVLADDAVRARWREASADAVLTPAPGGIRLQAKGRDPWVHGPTMAVDLRATRLVRVVVDGTQARGASLKVYFRTDESPLLCEAQSVEVPLPAQEGAVALAFDLSGNPFWRGREVTLRLDLENARSGDAIELREVELVTTASELHGIVLPAVPPLPRERFHLLLSLQGESLAITAPELSSSMEVLARPHAGWFAEAAAAPVRVAWALRSAAAGLQSVTVSPLGVRGVLTADVWVRDPSAPPVEASSAVALLEEVVVLRGGDGDVRARVVPEIAVLLAAGPKLRRVAIVLTRSVSAEGGVLRLQGARRIDGVEVRAELAVGPAEAAGPVERVPWSVELTFAAPLMVIDVVLPPVALGDAGARGLALLPGVEMLAGDAAPSGDATLPDPSWVAWNAAFVEQRGRVHAAVWRDADLQPRFASPDTVAGTSDHVLVLHAPRRAPGRLAAPVPAAWTGTHRFAGHVLAGEGRAGAILAVAEALAVEAPAVDASAAVRSAAEALARSFRGPTGMTLPRVGARPDEEYLEPRAVLVLLSEGRRGMAGGEDAARAEVARFRQTEGARRIPLSLGLAFPELLPGAVAWLAEESSALVSSQRPSGTWPPVLPPGCHHPTPERLAETAAAIAEPLSRLLLAHALGVAPAEPARRALARLSDDRLLPTGAQSWEFGPLVPEVLGAAVVADALRLAHEVGLAEDGLVRALDWLALGLTFFHIGRGDHPFACFPALGVTRDARDGALWYTHAPGDRLDWRGISCPWVGLRFAESLELHLEAASRHGGLDPRHADVLQRVSRGTLAHALARELPDGSLPDGFVVARGVETEPLHRAPIDIAWHAGALDGRGLSVRVARTGGVACAALGAFRRKGAGLELLPSLPGASALLVAGAARLTQAGAELPATEVLPGLRSSVLAGTAPVFIVPA